MGHPLPPGVLGHLLKDPLTRKVPPASAAWRVLRPRGRASRTGSSFPCGASWRKTSGSAGVHGCWQSKRRCSLHCKPPPIPRRRAAPAPFDPELDRLRFHHPMRQLMFDWHELQRISSQHKSLCNTPVRPRLLPRDLRQRPQTGPHSRNRAVVETKNRCSSSSRSSSQYRCRGRTRWGRAARNDDRVRPVASRDTVRMRTGQLCRNRGALGRQMPAPRSIIAWV